MADPITSGRALEGQAPTRGRAARAVEARANGPAMLGSVKRSPELSQLSRDHHQALYAALGLRRATDDDAGKAVESFRRFWDQQGQRHFRIEEQVLLPAFVVGGGSARDGRVARMLTEHLDIRARARELAPCSAVRELHELGERLAAHVRFEEDELFALIERTLEPRMLSALAAELDRAERDL